MKNRLKQLELFLKRSNFNRGIRLAVGFSSPIFLLYLVDSMVFAPSIIAGVLLNAPSDIPGSLKRKVNAILISIGLTMLVTLIVFFSKPLLPVLLLTISLVSFFVSLISVYGFRASLVSFSGLIAMVLAFAVQKETAQDILIHTVLIGVGGFIYLAVSLIFHKIAPAKDQNKLLSETLLLIGKYLKLRAQLLTKQSEREELRKQIFIIHNQINEKHETLRETLVKERKRSGRSRYEEKQLLIFLSSVNIFELIEAKSFDYKMIDQVFGEDKDFLKASKQLNKVMGNHLIRLSEILIQTEPLPSKDTLINTLDKAKAAIAQYVNAIKLPKAREGALVLRNIYDYQEQLLKEIRTIRRVMANVIDASHVSFKKQDSNKFITLEEYKLSIFIQSFSLKSKMFRHALRISIAIVFAYLLGHYLKIQNTYWILLTIVVIMRPNYGLTKERSKDRIIGTLIGAAIAVCIVLITQNMVIYALLGFVSFIFAFSLMQQNYKFAAALLTISIVFIYSLMHPNSLEVIQFRVLDTIIGTTIAVIVNYSILPSWEANNLKDILLKTLMMNKNYLLATQELYQNKSTNKIAYKIARKEAFLAISNLNAAFQRLTQDPKSKQKEYQLIYEIVTLNQTIVSAIASIGNFINHHKTTPPSKEFKVLIDRISNILDHSIKSLGCTLNNEKIEIEDIKIAEEELLDKYKQLSKLRDEEIELGKTEIDINTLHALQEAYLITNHLTWLISLSKNLEKATERYLNFIISEN